MLVLRAKSKVIHSLQRSFVPVGSGEAAASRRLSRGPGALETGREGDGDK